MTIDRKNLLQRVLTAIVGITALFGILRYGGLTGGRVVSTFLSLALLSEFGPLAFFPNTPRMFRIWFVAGGMLFALSCIFFPNFLEWALLVAFISNFLAYLFLSSGSKIEPEWTGVSHALFASWFGWIYCGLLPSYVARVSAFPDGWQWIFFLFALVWACDTGAYFAGNWIGGAKLNPRISPGKTWSGSIGGILATGLTGWGAAIWFFPLYPPSYLIGFALVVGLVSQGGDLCESLLKRAFGKKDSGRWLPGHGGFLDRFDSLLFGLPVLYIGLQLYTFSQWW